MRTITRTQFIVISLMLFSMFFGAGNFIFPPMLGKESGEIFYQTILYFCATAVLLPVLGVAAVARCGSVQALTGRVDRFFGPIFIVLIYLSIGPFLAIPRAANLPFEVGVAPIVGEAKGVWLVIWSVFFFIVNYLISVNKSQVVEVLGKWLTPVLLVMIALLVIGAVVADTPPLAAASGKYATAPTSTAFLAGYDTMDAMASIVFGIVVVNVLRDFGLKDSKAIVRTTIKTGIFAGALLSIIYIALAYLGAATAGAIGETENGAEILAKSAEFLFFGNVGQIILGIALFLACITTTVGLTTSGSDYFNSLTPKISYKAWCLVFSVVSALMANIGLSGILKFGVPILVAFYPVVIVLVLLALIDTLIDSSKLIYRSCIYITLVTGLIYSLGSVAKVLPQDFVEFVKPAMPFYDYGLGWVLWAIVAFCVTYIIHTVLKFRQ